MTRSSGLRSKLNLPHRQFSHVLRPAATSASRRRLHPDLALELSDENG